MCVEKIQGKWEKEEERESTCESDGETMKWNREQSRWRRRGRRGDSGHREEFPSIKSCFGLSSCSTVRGPVRTQCVFPCVCYSLSYIFHVPPSSWCLSTKGGISQSQVSVPSGQPAASWLAQCLHSLTYGCFRSLSKPLSVIRSIHQFDIIFADISFLLKITYESGSAVHARPLDSHRGW